MDERDGLGLRFWLKLGGLIILGGLVALVVFLIIGAALLTWGVIGGVIVFGALLIGAAWLFDRREARTRREWDEVGS
jgi:Flp pilus assembly protein TadB